MDSRIRFIERRDNEATGDITLCFAAPKELLPTDDERAAYAKISIEFPKDSIEASEGSAVITPVNSAGEEYDIQDYNISYEEIDAMIELYEKTVD